MICRHYWPHLYIDAASRDVRLADALMRSGMQVEVLTPRYASSWPQQLTHREIPVHRPLAAPRSGWSIGRYLKHLQDWLTERADQYDILFCTSLKEEVIPVVQTACRGSNRSVLGHGGTAMAADHLGWAGMRHGRRLRAGVQRADAIVVSWASVQRDLVALGVPPPRIHRIDLGVMAGAAPLDREHAGIDAAAIARSRVALAEINGDLALHRDSQVILACGQMSRIGGMMTLARAAPGLIDVWPDLRLWLIGDGSLREDLHAYFRSHGIRQNVAMPGTFVDLEDLFRVADLLVVPSPADALEDTLAAAIAAGVPVVIANSVDTRAWFSGEEQAVGWFAADDQQSLQAAIRAALIDPAGRRAAAERLRRDLLRRRPYAATVSSYKLLFDSLAQSLRHRQVASVGLRSQAEPSP